MKKSGKKLERELQFRGRWGTVLFRMSGTI